MDPAAQNEERLISRCKAGDAAGYGELVRLYQDRIFSTMYRLLGNTDDALDATQETFMKAYRAMGGFRRDSRFGTWLYRIAVNTAHSFRRRRRVAPDTVSLQLAGDDERGADPVAPGPEASERAAHAEELALVEQALRRLDEDHRQVIVLHELNGCDYGEIARILGCPCGTVKSRLHRARQELRRAVAGLLQVRQRGAADGGG